MHDLRRERLRKSRRVLNGNSSDGLLNKDKKGISPKGNGKAVPDGEGLTMGTRSVSNGVVRSESLIRDSRTEYAKSIITRGHSSSPVLDSKARHRRSDSMDSMRSQVRFGDMYVDTCSVESFSNGNRLPKVMESPSRTISARSRRSIEPPSETSRDRCC